MSHILMSRVEAYGLQSATPASNHEAQLLIGKWEGEEAFLIKPVSYSTQNTSIRHQGKKSK